MTFDIPRIQVKAQYRSSGVLILVQASGAGEYWGEYRESTFECKRLERTRINVNLYPNRGRACKGLLQSSASARHREWSDIFVARSSKNGLQR